MCTQNSKQAKRKCLGIFVSRLHPNTTKSQVKEHIFKKLDFPIETEKLQTKFETYASFLVKVKFDHLQNLLVPDIWPQGALIRKYYESIRLSIISNNCRNIKSSLNVLQDLCNKADILLLQKTWLYDFDLHMLNSIHKDFYGFGLLLILQLVCWLVDHTVVLLLCGANH